MYLIRIINRYIEFGIAFGYDAAPFLPIRGAVFFRWLVPEAVYTEGMTFTQVTTPQRLAESIFAASKRLGVVAYSVAIFGDTQTTKPSFVFIMPITCSSPAVAASSTISGLTS